MDLKLQVRDVLEALQNVDPTLQVTVNVLREDEEGQWTEEFGLLQVRQRSLDIVFETKE